ncbi:MAG: helix-turn-helix domain-containing protein [Burkholderiales bacterium]
MDRHSIAARLRQRRASQKHIAETLDVHINSVHQVIHGRMRSRRIAEHIADILGTTPDRLWPGAYETDSAAADDGFQRRAA